MSDDIDLRKQIAAEAQVGPGADASPAVRAFQYFLVPLLIVAVCAVAWWGVSWMVANPRTAAQWLEDVRSGGPNVRPHAALQLVQALRRAPVPDGNLTVPIVELYRETKPKDDPDQILRRTLLNCLGVLKDPRASELLLQVAADRAEHMDIRAAAMDALGAVKDPETLEPLVKFLDDSDPVIRKYAAFNAASVAERAGDRAVIEPLRARLKDPAADVGWNAAFGLAYFLGDGSGTDTLKKMLDRNYLEGSVATSDPNRDHLVARAMVLACNAAAKLKDPSFLPILRDLIQPSKERDQDVRFIANQAIHEIENKGK
jgi:HEAT repeat protein